MYVLNKENFKPVVENTPPRDFTYTPPQGMLKVIEEDAQFIVVEKPSGLLSVAGRDDSLADCLEKRVQDAYPTATIVHRLDMDTSGLMVLALNKVAHKNISRQFEKRVVEKTYIAHVHGHIFHDKGEINLPIRCDWEKRPKQMIDFEQGREAITLFDVKARLEFDNAKFTRVFLYPKTGRSHQLRVHMLILGHPILGDGFYGGDDNIYTAPRLCLHAHTLSFYHPIKGERLYFETPSAF